MECFTTVGICRPLPDVNGFVTPVFSDSEGEPFAQLFSERDLRIEGFARLSLGEEFQEIGARIIVSAGDDVLYGFQTDAGDLLLATARTLVRKLTAEPELAGRCPYIARELDELIAHVRRAYPREHR